MKRRQKNRGRVEKRRYHRIGSEDLYVRMLRVMARKRLYLNKKCSREGLARELMTNRTYVSRALNARGMNFARFVNSFRAEHAIELLARFDMAAVPLEDIAEMSGFTSVDKMNEYVKKSAGLSACALRKRLLEEN
jgi:AraC-like DNA-binding protein